MGCGSNNISFPSGLQGTQGPAGNNGTNGASVVYASFADETSPNFYYSVSNGAVTTWGAYMTSTGILGADPMKYTVPAAATGLVNKGGFYEIHTHFRIGATTEKTGPKSVGLRLSTGHDLIKFTINTPSPTNVQKILIITRFVRAESGAFSVYSIIHEGIDSQMLNPVNVYTSQVAVPVVLDWTTGLFEIFPTCEATVKLSGDILCDYMIITKFLK